MTIWPWTDDDDEVAFDAITVGIGSDTAVLESLGLSSPETVASVYWPDWIAGRNKVLSAMEGPYSVPEALDRAEVLSDEFHLRVAEVNLVHHQTYWEPAQNNSSGKFPGPRCLASTLRPTCRG